MPLGPTSTSIANAGAALRRAAAATIPIVSFFIAILLRLATEYQAAHAFLVPLAGHIAAGCHIAAGMGAILFEPACGAPFASLDFHGLESQ